jgi:benzoyl-CoA reductase/2-hydroxyglutaryl-CoA dehydratase subunit BcrC/BadD/HgdB
LHRVGFTSTIPLEILVAAGRTPVDLNNIFITSPDSGQFIESAEIEGFPRNVCGWIKGIYAAVLKTGIREMIAVTEGDCSYTRGLMEVLSLDGITVIPFAYPQDRDPASMALECDKLMRHYGVDRDQVAAAKVRLDCIRRKIAEIDRLTWQENLVSGRENHYFQVSSSDMNSDPDRFEEEIDTFLEGLGGRAPFRQPVRLAYIGVPPIVGDLYDFMETQGGRVVFNETQRQFAMPFDTDDLVKQYLRYTYPYDIFTRLADILLEGNRRQIHGVIHYVQSFCFRQIEDIIIRRKLPWPVLTLEGDKPSPLDARSKIRIEGFLEMLQDEQ